ncbi:MAG: hypothetical protein IJD92_03755 [Bacilli bacterium]|nr:hypothetical protein [Bacilli bacterium]
MKPIYECELKVLKDYLRKDGCKNKEFYTLRDDYDTFTFGSRAYFDAVKEEPDLDYFTFNKREKIDFNKIYVTKTILPYIVREIITGKLFYLHDDDNTVYEINEFNPIKPVIVPNLTLKKINSDKKALEKFGAYVEKANFIKDLITEISNYEKDFYDLKENNKKTKKRG